MIRNPFSLWDTPSVWALISYRSQLLHLLKPWRGFRVVEGSGDQSGEKKKQSQTKMTSNRQLAVPVWSLLYFCVFTCTWEQIPAANWGLVRTLTKTLRDVPKEKTVCSMAIVFWPHRWFTCASGMAAAPPVNPDGDQHSKLITAFRIIS